MRVKLLTEETGTITIIKLTLSSELEVGATITKHLPESRTIMGRFQARITRLLTMMTANSLIISVQLTQNDDLKSQES